MNGFLTFSKLSTLPRTLCCLGLLSLVLVAGCSTRAPQAVRTEMVPFTPEEQAQLTSARGAEYRLRPGDRLAVDFKYENDLDRSNLLILPSAIRQMMIYGKAHQGMSKATRQVWSSSILSR